MRRGPTIWTISILGAILVILAVALAAVGTHLDRARIQESELQFQVDDLQEAASTLSQERDKLKKQAEEQSKAIDQLKAELERTRGQAQPPAPAPAATQ